MKLKDLVKESKYLKREFGESLPTFDSVMKQHQEEIKEGKFEVFFDLDPDASPAQRLGLMSVEVMAKDKKEAEKMVASKFVGGMKLIKKGKTKQLKEGLNEISKEIVDTKKVAANMKRDKSGFFGNSWAKAIMKKYPKGVSEDDLQNDLPDYIAGSAISNLFK